MIRSGLCRLTSELMSCTREACILRTTATLLVHVPSHGGLTAQHHFDGRQFCHDTLAAKCTDLSTQKYSLIYRFPHISVLRAISRLKLLQTGITVVTLPPVYYFYLQGDVSYFLASYATGVAVFAGAMLYAASHVFRRVVGMMYLDSSQTTLKVSHLTFWGKRHDMYLPVSDVMTVGDAGDSVGEPVMRLKRYSSGQTLYYSTKFGCVVDRHAFEKVFGALK